MGKRQLAILMVALAATIGNTFVPVFVPANSGNTANRTDVFETTAGP